MSKNKAKALKNNVSMEGPFLETDPEDRAIFFYNATKNQNCTMIWDSKIGCGYCADNAVFTCLCLSGMHSHHKGGLKIPIAPVDKVKPCPFIQGAESRKPTVGHACACKKQRTTSSTKERKDEPKNEASLTVPKKETAPKLDPCQPAKHKKHPLPSIKGPKNAQKNKKEVTPELDTHQSAKSKEHPFNEGYGDKMLSADCYRIAFGFWENDKDEDDNFWCLVKLGHPSVGFPGRLTGAYKKEHDYLKEHDVANKNTIIVEFFEESNEGERGVGGLSTNNLDKDSLRRVSSVKQLKECKDKHCKLLSDEVKKYISTESMYIVDQMTLANNLSKHKEIEDAFLGTDK